MQPLSPMQVPNPKIQHTWWKRVEKKKKSKEYETYKEKNKLGETAEKEP